jgi:hypothetical protein
MVSCQLGELPAAAAGATGKSLCASFKGHHYNGYTVSFSTVWQWADHALLLSIKY